MLLEKTYALNFHKVFQYSIQDVFVSQIRVILNWQITPKGVILKHHYKEPKCLLIVNAVEKL